MKHQGGRQTEAALSKQHFKVKYGNLGTTCNFQSYIFFLFMPLEAVLKRVNEEGDRLKLLLAGIMLITLNSSS